MVTNGQTTRFAYDAFGRRVRKEGPSGTTQYVHQGDHVALELDGQQNVTAEYTWFPGVDRPHSVIRNGNVYYYARGPTNSVTGLFDTSGSPVNEYRYSPWGETESAVEGVENPYRYTGRRFDDETGLYHNRARYYDPDLGRFVSQDPLGLGAGINPYAYAGNDPVNARDPSGLLVGTECETTVLVTFVKESGDIVDVIELGTSCPSRGGSGGSSGGGGAGSGSPGAPKLPKPDTLESAATEWAECVNNNEFSSLFSNPTAQKVIGFLEFAGPANLFADLRAMRAKAARSGIAGPHGPGASAFNYLARRALGASRATEVVVKVGGKVGPALTLFGAFSLAYNGTIEAQCTMGVIE